MKHFEITILKELMDPRKRKQRKKRRLERKQHKKSMKRLFGRARYYLSILFGQWVLAAWNKRDYRTVELQKYYSSEKVAQKYARSYREKYDTVEMETVYNRQRLEIGYLVICKGKKAVWKQPSNVIDFSQYIKNKKLLKALQ